MCGIVGVVRRRATRPVPDAADLVQELDRALAGVRGRATAMPHRRRPRRAPRRGRRGGRGRSTPRSAAFPGVRALLGDPQAALLIDDRIEQLTGRFDALERELDDGLGGTLAPASLEAVNAALVRARDAVWAVGRDRLRTAREVAALAGADPSVAALEAFHSVQVALSAIDRLEVRGRDSAGLHLLVRQPRSRPRRARRSAGWSRRAPPTRSSVPARCAPPATSSRSSTRRRPRSASSATTPRCCAPPSATTRCCTSRSRTTTPR